MGNTWSQFKGQRNEKNRKKPYRVISESERDVITKNKAQMEEQINALNEKVNMEKAAWVSARNSSLPLGEKIARISLALESAKVIDTGEPAVNDFSPICGIFASKMEVLLGRKVRKVTLQLHSGCNSSYKAAQLVALPMLKFSGALLAA
ncbi:PREDICTED: uncharacterized protein LOC107341764 [Acropora digitifera]|uniref:uncharacterized protein LOC107341764 n=1 Tax=Acropora digitifera TaxID=70779 RepID=UPI00077A15C0|nr:PREDICTED: uncharacterized protein LOC107341764 [Acropora digitifera]